MFYDKETSDYKTFGMVEWQAPNRRQIDRHMIFLGFGLPGRQDSLAQKKTQQETTIRYRLDMCLR